MLIFFIKSQLALFDAPVNVAASVRKDGTVVKPHVRIMKIAHKPMAQHSLFAEMEAPEPRRPAPPKVIKPTTLDLFAPEDLPDHESVKALADLKARVRRFASGMSRAKDFNAAVHADHGVGVEVGQLSDQAMRELAKRAVENHAQLFVDSGAFSVFKRGLKVEEGGAPVAGLDFDAILGSYDKLLGYIQDANDAEEHVTPPLVVMPDLVGDQAGSLNLITQHRDWIRSACEFNTCRPIIPLQRGERTIAEAYDDVVRILGTDKFVCGIPSNAAAISGEEFTEFLRSRKPKAVHILGALHDSRLTPRLEQIVASGQAGAIDVSADANVLRSQIIERGVSGPARADRIVEKLGVRSRADELEQVLARFGGKDGVRKMLLTAPMREASKMLGLIADLSGRSLDDVMADYGSAPAPADVSKPAPKIDTSAERVDPVNVSFGVPAGISKGKRREINATAAGLVHSGADLTDADRATLRQYSGNGGCGDSLNEFYTDPEVAAAMWTVLGKLGVTTGAVLEPSCATGVFMHTAPAGVRVTGVEMDPTSAAIADVLHGERHEVVNASLERFATTDGTRQFDAVIGNAPFGIRGSLIKDDKSELKTAEGYFLDTSLDKCRPGGVVAMIVPTGVMDSKSARAVRQRLLCKGEFLGAVRMPNTAFEHSHTEVTTDIVFFRKRPDDVAGALMTLDKPRLKALGVWDDEYLSGGYFEGRGAASIFGTMEAGWRAKAGIGQDITVSGSMIGVPDAVAAWAPDEHTSATPSVPDILAAIGDNDSMRKKALGGTLKRPYEGGKAGDTKTEDGVAYILQGKPLRWHRVDEFTQSADVTDAQQLARDIEAAINGGPREGLADRVRAYVDAHGAPGKNKNLLVAASQDRVLYRLIGAVGADGQLSDVVADRAARRVEGSLDVAAQSLALEHDSGLFTVAELAERMDKPAEDVEDTLFASSAYAYAGDGLWTPMDRYVTGELWPKLDALRAAIAHGELREGMAEKYELQVKRLEDAIDPKSLEDVEILMNSAFLPLAVLEAFFADRQAVGNEWERKQAPLAIEFKDSWYTITGGTYETKLLADYLNRDGVKRDELPKIEKWNTDFKEWLLGSQYRDQVEDLYNRKFRGFVQAEYSDAPIDIPGMNTDGLKQFQYSGLRWALAAGKGIVAADVGLGKTVRGLMLARMAKINGTAKRPTFVVPKSVLANWVAEAEKWLPGSRIMVVGETYTRDKEGNLKSKSDTADERNRKLHDIRQNDYDFVFISQPAFNDIDLDPITKGQYVNSDFWVQRGDKKGNEGDKRIKKVREAYDQAVANREFQRRSDAVYWNDLGIDMMIVDEGHGYKNLYAAKQRFGESPKFLGGQGQSNRAFDMNMKTRYLREHNGGNGVFLLTATPTKNSPLEIYSMLSHVAPEAFERIGIRNSEEFLDRFCTFVDDKVLSTSGTIEDAIVTAGFKNLGELREIMRRYIDRKTAADVGLVMPARDDRMHMVDMSARQHEVYADLRQQMIDSAKEKDSTGDSHVFSIMSRMGKAALDLELLDAKEYAGEVSPKYQAMAKEIVAGAKEGGQVVFSESVDSHEKIVAALVAAGIPRAQIAIMNAGTASSSAKRQNISDGFNSGKFKVVVGNKIMEEGVNLQKGTTDVHHADLPWDPASMQQRNGRGLRQGNLNASVRIHTYLSKGSFDGYRYQSMMAKKDWQDMLWNGGDSLDNLGRAGKFDRADLMIMMSADPEAERAKYETDKVAATQRHDTEQRREVAVEFKRLQVMKQSYGALKNKESASAARLRQQVERARTKLASNKYFTAKGALDASTPVVIHPDTGMALMTGVGLQIDEADGTAGKWVITGVSPVTGSVSMRRYGQVGKGAMAITVSQDKLAGGVAPFAFDAGAEAKHVQAQLEEAAAASLNSLGDWKDVQAMPSAVLEANHDLIQRQIKDGAKSYKFNMPHGSVPMVNKVTGELKMAESYEHTKMHETHDYMLPTDAAKDKVMQGWLDAQRDARFLTHYQTSGRRGSQSTRVARREYPGAKYDSKNINPFKSLMDSMSGGTTSYGTDSSLVKEAKQRLQVEQHEKLKHATDIGEAFNHALALGDVEDAHAEGKAHVRLPAKTLAMLWAKSRQLGQLGAKVPQTGHNGYAVARADGGTVHNALVRMARAGGHHDLAHAMAESAARHHKDAPARETYDTEVHDTWPGNPHAAARFKRALAAAEAGGFADELKSAGQGWGNYGGYDHDRNKTKRQFLTEKIAESNAHIKHKEAA